MSEETAVRTVIAVSSIMLAPCLGIAFFSLRRAKPGHLRVPWYILSLATVCLVGINLTSIIVTGVLWTKGRSAEYDLGELYHSPHLPMQRAAVRALILLSGLYSILIVVACRAAFWEYTNAYDVLRHWQHNMTRFILLAFDLALALVALILLALFTATDLLGPYLRSILDLTNYVVFDGLFSLGFQYVVAAGYINATVGVYFLRTWSRKYNLGVPIADAIFTFVSPALLVQTLLLIALTIVYEEKFYNDRKVFYASIPWRMQQIVVLGLFVGVLRTHPLRQAGDPPLESLQNAQPGLIPIRF